MKLYWVLYVKYYKCFHYSFLATVLLVVAFVALLSTDSPIAAHILYAGRENAIVDTTPLAYCCCFASVWLLCELFARSNIFWSVFAVLLNCKPDPNWTLNWPSFPFHAAGTHFRGREPEDDRTTLVRRLLFGLAFAELIRTKSLTAGPLTRKARSVKVLPSDWVLLSSSLSPVVPLSDVCVQNSWFASLVVWRWHVAANDVIFINSGSRVSELLRISKA